MARKILLRILFIAIIVVLLTYFFIIRPALSATHEYNEAVNEYNELSEKYNAELTRSCVDNVEGIAISPGTLESESETLWEITRTVFSGNTAVKIRKDTATVYELIKKLENDFKIVKQVTNPSSEWVEKRLKSVSKIVDIEAVSEGNDPNQMLGKKGGYTNCLYFTVSDIDSDSVEGDTVVEKGTDAGGAIEIYSSVEDAESRCEYLAGFDNTLLYSGSYAIVGTMVIRTSYRLEGESQLQLTDEITKAFTMII